MQILTQSMIAFRCDVDGLDLLMSHESIHIKETSKEDSTHRESTFLFKEILHNLGLLHKIKKGVQRLDMESL